MKHDANFKKARGNPLAPSLESQSAPIAAHVANQLGQYERSYRAGSLPALYEALGLCLDKKMAAPRWAIVGAMRAMEVLSPFHRTTRRGRAANPIARYRQDLIHANRHYTVEELREMQEEAGMDLRRLEKSAANSRALAEARALCERVGKTWEDAYRIAAQELRGTPAYGSPATIKASYQLVKKMFRVPETAPRFMPLKSETLRRFGIRDIR